MHRQTHSLLFQWFFEVSKTVGGFAITGILGFIAVKVLKLDKRKLSDVPWLDVWFLVTGVSIILGYAVLATIVLTHAAWPLRVFWLLCAIPLFRVVMRRLRSLEHNWKVSE